MQSDLLQQMRDLHLPVEPLWWPPAPGLWLVGLLIVGLIWLGVLRLRQAQQRRRPFRSALALYQQLHARYLKDEITRADYLHQSNELLKRLVIFGIRHPNARRANDSEWLAVLDELSNSQAFTDGPGSALGNQRFSANADADIDALHPVLLRFFEAARP